MTYEEKYSACSLLKNLPTNFWLLKIELCIQTIWVVVMFTSCVILEKLLKNSLYINDFVCNMKIMTLDLLPRGHIMMHYDSRTEWKVMSHMFIEQTNLGTVKS